MDESTRLKVYKFLEAPLVSAGRVIFPSHVDKLLLGLAETELGPDWAQDPEVAGWLKKAFGEVYQDTLDAAPPVWNREKYLAHLFGMSPLHFQKVPVALRELLRTQPPAASNVLKVLDVGAGCGIASLSLLYFFELYSNALDILDVMGDEGRPYIALTPLDTTKEALDLYSKVIYSYLPTVSNFGYDLATPLQVAIKETTSINEVLGEELYDIILVSHVLSELREMGLERRAQVLVDLAANLSPSGALIFIETSTAGGIQSANQLKSRTVNKGLDLYGPCAHIFSRPTGPICFTCSLSRREEIALPQISHSFFGVVGSMGANELVSKNQWTYGIFRKDGAIHHPALEEKPEGISRIADVAKKKTTGRGEFLVQIARRETEPFLFYKVCDQTAKTDECYLVFEIPVPPEWLEIGTVLQLKSARIDFSKRPGGEKLKNSMYLVVDQQCEIVDLTAQAGCLPTAGLWQEGA